MDNSQLFKEREGGQQLDGESSYVMHIEWAEVVGFQELVEVGCKYFCYDADVPSKYYEIFDTQKILTILYILLFYLH
jgi:hypothetical protein